MKLVLRLILVILAAVLFQVRGFAQENVEEFEVKSELLTRPVADSIFSDSLKMSLNINHDIYRVYRYQDLEGEHLLVMTENAYGQKQELNFDTIKAYCFRVKDRDFVQEWMIRDFILPERDPLSEELTIWFWTKYLKLEDFDGDGLVDPVLVYGTGYSEGRTKILLFHKGKKRAVRHQNFPLDYFRKTQVDKEFLQLSDALVTGIREIIQGISNNNHSLFEWEDLVDYKLYIEPK